MEVMVLLWWAYGRLYATALMYAKLHTIANYIVMDAGGCMAWLMEGCIILPCYYYSSHIIVHTIGNITRCNIIIENNNCVHTM